MKMYKTEKGSIEIEEIDVERASEHSVWYEDIHGNSRFARHSNYKDYWSTWDEALDHLINSAEERKMRLLRQVEKLNDEIGILLLSKKEA